MKTVDKRRRAERRQAFMALQTVDPQSLLRITGTSYPLVADLAQHSYLEDETNLVQCPSDKDVLVDRFDGRMLLDNISLEETSASTGTNDHDDEDPMISFERYTDLIDQIRLQHDEEDRIDDIDHDWISRIQRGHHSHATKPTKKVEIRYAYPTNQHQNMYNDADLFYLYDPKMDAVVSLTFTFSNRLPTKDIYEILSKLNKDQIHRLDAIGLSCGVSRYTRLLAQARSSSDTSATGHPSGNRSKPPQHEHERNRKRYRSDATLDEYGRSVTPWQNPDPANACSLSNPESSEVVSSEDISFVSEFSSSTVTPHSPGHENNASVASSAVDGSVSSYLSCNLLQDDSTRSRGSELSPSREMSHATQIVAAGSNKHLLHIKSSIHLDESIPTMSRTELTAEDDSSVSNIDFKRRPRSEVSGRGSSLKPARKYRQRHE
ncbi:hypothetical protein BASA50_003343 [Batrachochytrium salamandrivorans]|uniref:Suppressor of white apricot N-terminal domain-containing protein n=1 Tax=Batrachochytrium salamandrivorans TaxID=1357716 RepID=A0ABQ8FIF3_9FUNG|nr:hypothetical protein BASA50_003343 [Batrachochytrium salamandrivorans]